jgi:hypothetical protein
MEEQVAMDAKNNVLYELAQAMATEDGHSAAVALRKLAQAGYGSLDEVDSASDWTLLSIPGLGVGRLGAVRRLTRLDWQPPSPQAVKAVSRFVSAAKLALRFWPPETLASLILGSRPVSSSGQPYERRLAIECFSRATHQALNHCRPGELVEIMRAARNGCQCPHLESYSVSGAQAGSHKRPRREVPASTTFKAAPRQGNQTRETDHFAYPEHERRDIVRHYRAARERGEVQNKERWAHSNYSISARTLLSYEHEFPEDRAKA